MGPWERAGLVVAEQTRRIRRRALAALTETGRYLARDDGRRCPDCGVQGRWDVAALELPCSSRKCREQIEAAGQTYEAHTHARGAVVCPQCGQVLSLSRVARVAACGRETAQGAVYLRAYAHRVTGELRATFAGLRRCKNGWRCPTCAQRIQLQAARELHACNLGFRTGHRAGIVLLVTLTMRHPPGLPAPMRQLEPMRRAVTRAYQQTLGGRGVYAWRRRFGILAAVRALEVTHSPGTASWHPHVHTLLFLRRKLTPARTAELRAWYLATWGDAIEAQTWDDPDTGRPHHYDRPLAAGVDIREADKAGRYLSKMGLLDVAAEVAAGATKIARCASCGAHRETAWNEGRRRCAQCGAEVNRTPFQILADFHEHHEQRDKRLWLHYYRGILGARRLTWTRWRPRRGAAPFKLRELYVPEQAAIALPDPVSALWLNPKIVKALPADRRADALDAFERGDRAGLETALGDAMPAIVLPDEDAPTPRATYSGEEIGELLEVGALAPDGTIRETRRRRRHGAH